jgi:hypothetical protein
MQLPSKPESTDQPSIISLSELRKTYLAIIVDDLALRTDDDLGVVHAFATWRLALVLLASRLGQVVDSDEDGDGELLCELLQADLVRSDDSGDGQSTRLMGGIPSGMKATAR